MVFRDDIVEQIDALPDDRDEPGATPPDIAALAAILDLMLPIRFSLQTGSGKVTLLLSHLSISHKVFAPDDASVAAVRASPLVNAAAVEYIVGPPQRTLPAYRFAEPVDVALLDGPHGYPFPDLEYFHVYPHIRPGGLLMLDDIHIPTVRRMFDILRVDAMWAPEAVIGQLAILRRTEHAGVGADEDGWWKQGFNRPLLERTEAHRRDMASSAGRALRSARDAARRLTPDRLRRAAKLLLHGRAD